MKEIKIFIAGSKYGIETERDIIRKIAYSIQTSTKQNNDDKYIIHTVSFEDFKSHIDLKEHQVAYEKYIVEEADIVFFIFRGCVGSITEKEFDVAYSTYQTKGHPRIHVLSHYDEGLSILTDSTIINKFSKFKEIGIYYEEYRNNSEFSDLITKDLRQYIDDHRSHLHIIRNRWHKIITRSFRLLVMVVTMILSYMLLKEVRFFNSLCLHQQFNQYVNSKRSLKALYINKAKHNIQQIESLSNEINNRYNCNVRVEDMSLYRLRVLDELLFNMIPIQCDSQNIYISKYEVSELEYLIFENGEIRKSNFPKTDITYADCNRYIDRLNSLTNLNFRLPTIEEWEFASNPHRHYKYSGSDDINAVAWYRDNADGRKHERFDETKYLFCNEFNIYDMSGHVSEFCKDSVVFNGHVLYAIKGGNYLSDTAQVKNTFTDWLPKLASSPAVGFRLILEK